MSFPVVLATDLMLNVRNVDRAQRDVEKAIGGGAAAGLTGAMKTTRKELTAGFSKVYIDAIKVGNKEQAAQIKAEYKQRADRVKSLGDQMATLNSKIQASDSEADKKRFAARKDNLEELVGREQRAQKHMLEDRAAGMSHIVKLYDEGMEKSGRKFEDKAQGAAESFTDIVNKGLTLDSLNPDDLVRGIGASLKKNAGSMVSGGKNMMAKGAEMAEKGGAVGGAGKAMAAMGRLGAAVGAAAGVIAGVAVAVAAVVAIFAAAYGKVKEWNKAILSSATGYDIMTGSLTTVDKALHTHRKMMSRVSRQWNMAGEEVAALTGALHQQGLTFGEMKGWTNARNELVGLTKAANFAVIQTKSLGISADELGTLTNRMYEGFGFGLREMTEAMAKFGSQAQMAGMSTRSFVAAVMEATANMALYNFRLEDTSKLLIGLTKILGEDLAKATAGMSGTFKDASFQENYKSTMTGGKALGGVIDASATRQLKGTFKDMSRGQQQFMREQGLISGRGDEIEIDYEKLGNLSGLESGEIMNKLEAMGMGMDSFEALTDLAAGIGGNNSEKADALANLDRTGEIAATVAKALGILKVNSLEGLGPAGRVAFEDQTGLQGKDLATFEAIYNRIGATMKEGDKGGTKYGKDGPNWAQISKAIAGGEVGLSAKDVKALDTLMPQEQLDVATQTLHATQTIGDVLKGKISGALNWIGGGITGVLDHFMKDDGDKEQKAAAKAVAYAKEHSESAAALTEEIRGVERDTSVKGAKKEAKLLALEKKREYHETQQYANEELSANLTTGGLKTDAAYREKFYDSGGSNEYIKRQVKQETDRPLGTSATEWYGWTPNMTGMERKHSAQRTDGHVALRAKSSEDNAAVRNLPLDLIRAFQGTKMDYFSADEVVNNTPQVNDMTAHNWQSLINQFVADEQWTDDKTATDTGAAVVAEEQLAIAEETAATDAEALEVAKDSGKDEEKAARKAEASAAALQKALSNLEESNDVLALYAAIDSHNLTADPADQVTAYDIMNNKRGARGFLNDTTKLGLDTDQRKRLKARFTPGVDDFVYRGDSFGGTITPINAADDLLGMKPGGAIDRALGGGRGGGTIHTVNIYESGDPKKTLRMVEAALKAAEGNSV